MLLRDFLRSLCSRLTTDAKKARGLPAAAPYCDAEQRFTADLTTPPVLRVADQRGRAKQAMRLRFTRGQGLAGHADAAPPRRRRPPGLGGGLGAARTGSA